MSIPASMTVVTVTGKVLDVNGNPRSGTVTFRTKGFTMSGTDDTFIVPRTVTATLDVNGAFAVALPSTTDPQWTPVGWTYRVVFDFGDDARQDPFDIVVPHNLGSTLSLASLAPVPQYDGQLYALYNDPRFSSIGGGGGSTVVPFTVRSPKLTGGPYTMANSALTAVGSSVQIAAATGDVLRVDISALCSPSAFPLQFEAATRNANDSADLRYWSSEAVTSLLPGGVPSWYVEGVSGKFGSPTGPGWYTVQAGDISGGVVTVRLYGFGGGGTRDIVGSNAYPFSWSLTNMRH